MDPMTGQQKKLNFPVNYPREELNIPVQGEKGKETIVTYDLYGVSKHYGDQHGGHYMSSTLDPIDNNWYNYNDAIVEGKLISETEIVSKYAYVLYYRKRGKDFKH